MPCSTLGPGTFLMLSVMKDEVESQEVESKNKDK